MMASVPTATRISAASLSSTVTALRGCLKSPAGLSESAAEPGLRPLSPTLEPDPRRGAKESRAAPVTRAIGRGLMPSIGLFGAMQPTSEQVFEPARRQLGAAPELTHGPVKNWPTFSESL